MVKVTFLPSLATTAVPVGTLLVDAAAEAGVPLEMPCGGQGRCGRCQVKVEGKVSRRENLHLTPQQIKEGWVLACVARVMGDASVTIPSRREQEKVIIESAASRKAAALRPEWPIHPIVRQIYLELPHPTLEDNASDLERLRRVLTQQEGIADLRVPLPLLQRMATLLRQEEYRVTAILETDTGASARLLDLIPGRKEGPLWACAVDIGTTTIWVYLVNLLNGRLVDQAASFNKQISCGEDVISRIVYSQRGQGLAHLQHLVVETINDLLAELAQRHSLDTAQIYEMVAAGNTIMTHLFLGLPSRNLREEPYVPTATSFPPLVAGEVGLNVNPLAAVHCLPAVAAYVGGDISAGVLSSGLHKKENLTLFLDVGTNGEIVLGNAEWLMTCACSAGPAFEGAGVACGMRATAGAIDDVRVNSLTLEPTIKVMGNVAPRGICGSGMISALAEMLITGVVTKAGRIDVDWVTERMAGRSRARVGDHGPEYVLVWAKDSATGQDILLNQVDIDNLVRTKGAIYAGIRVLAQSIGIDLSQVEEVLIGGAFGQHINIEEAIQIGLLPDLPWEKFKFMGNTSARGAYYALISRQARSKVKEIASKMTYKELIADNTFMNEFTSALFLPHTQLEDFPTVKALLRDHQGTGINA
ncbi:MAG: DUF4445 domain-containing protein [Chloroflexi bacterium]|nr:DUF4445 domain-containing protein [Chloroflexota bacterium]